MTHYPKFFLKKGFEGHLHNLKNSLEFKLLAFWRENKNTFIDQKCTYEKVTKIWAGPSPTPPQLEKIQKNSIFFGTSSLRLIALLFCRLY